MEARAPANRRHRPSRTHKALAALARKVSRAAAKYYSKVARERAHEEDEWFDYGDDLSDVIRGVTFVQNVEYPDVLEPSDSEGSSDSDGEEDGEIAGDDEEAAIVQRADAGEGENADEGQEGIGEAGGEEDIEVVMINCYLAEEMESRIPNHEGISLSEATTCAEEKGAAEGGSSPPTTHPDKRVPDLDRDGKVPAATPPVACHQPRPPTAPRPCAGAGGRPVRGGANAVARSAAGAGEQGEGRVGGDHHPYAEGGDSTRCVSEAALKRGRGAPPTTQPQEPSPARQQEGGGAPPTNQPQEPAPAREHPHSAGGAELMKTMVGAAGRALRLLRRS